MQWFAQENQRGESDGKFGRRGTLSSPIAVRPHISPGPTAFRQKTIAALNCLLPQLPSVMSSYGAVMPAAARSILSSCRPSFRGKSISPIAPIFQQVRGAKNMKGKGKSQPKQDRRGPREFRQKNLKDMEQYALCDAMRYVCFSRSRT